ncbi:MAG: ATP-binding protein [Pseudomonadota bacterium]
MKSGTFKLGLRGRILLVLLLAAGLRAAVMVDYLVEQKEADIAAARRNLAVQARNAGKELTTRIDAAQHLLFGLTHARELDTQDREACSAFLAGVLQNYPQYTGILTITPDGALFCDSLRTGRQLNLSDRAYFRKAMESPGLALEPAFGRLTGLGVMQAAMASRDAAGQVRFVMLVSINLDRIARSVVATQPYADTVLTLFDREATVLAANANAPVRVDGPRLLGKSLASTELGRFAMSAQDGATAEFVGPSGVSRVWAAAGLPPAWNTGLKLTLGVPTQQLVEAAESRARSVFAGVLAATILVVLVGLALAEWGIRRPIARILKASARFSGGDLNARIGEPYPGGEIGDLMRELDLGAERGQEQQEEIRRFNVLLEERVRQRTAELEAANEELKAFSYSIAHDLRQPLISMNGYAGLLEKSLKNGPPPPETVHYLGRMRAGVGQISDLADAMVSLAHLSRTSLVLEEVDLSELAGEAAHACREREPGRAVNVQIQPGLRCTADRPLMKLALRNLMDNAWKFSAGRQPAEISFGMTLGEGGAPAYFIRDNGAGFDMAYAAKLFTAFHRMHSPAEFSGTGIGLANVGKIIGRHGGRIWAEAAPGAGAVFYFTLGRPAGGPERA